MVGKNPIPFTLGPTIIRDSWTDEVSKVFDHPINLYSCNLMTIPSNLVSLDSSPMSPMLLKKVTTNFDNRSKANFSKIVDKLMGNNTNKTKTIGGRNNILFY